MGMPHTADRWTADRVRALPDDANRYELVSGELVVTPSPRAMHQSAISELEARLRPFAAGVGAYVLHSPADVSLGEDELLQPDLFACRTASGRLPRDWSDISTLLLGVEVTSPSTARYDRTLKRLRYQRARVPEYWIVDLDARLIERWRPDDARPEILAERLVWQPVEGRPSLEIELAAMFAEIHGEG